MCDMPQTFKPRSGSMEGRTFRGVACRRCFSCLKARQNDMVGRCIAEARVAVAVSAVHLTYRDDAKAKDVRVISDERKHEVQKWIKRLRKKHQLRYLVAGEYGDRNGRLHFHAIIFWHSRPPDMRGTYQNDSWNNRDPYWDHGRTVWDDLGSGMKAANAIRYACYYVVKGVDDIADYEELNKRNGKPHLQYFQTGGGPKGGNSARRTWYTVSTRPALGCAYFTRLALNYVDHGLAPRKAEYWFGDIPRGRNKKTGKFDRRPFIFKLQKASATMLHFVREYERLWNERRPGVRMPPSELITYVEDHHSKKSGWDIDKPFMNVRENGVYYPPDDFVKPERPMIWPDPVTMPDGETPIRVRGEPNPAIPVRDRAVFCERRRHWYVKRDGDPAQRVWSWDASGQPAWVTKIVAHDEAARRRKAVIAADKPLWLPKRERIARDKAAAAAARFKSVSGSTEAAWYSNGDDVVQRFVAAVERHFGPLSADAISVKGPASAGRGGQQGPPIDGRAERGGPPEIPKGNEGGPGGTFPPGRLRSEAEEPTRAT